LAPEEKPAAQPGPEDPAAAALRQLLPAPPGPPVLVPAPPAPRAGASMPAIAGPVAAALIGKDDARE
jgi:hypothetical protein